MVTMLHGVWCMVHGACCMVHGICRSYIQSYMSSYTIVHDIVQRLYMTSHNDRTSTVHQLYSDRTSIVQDRTLIVRHILIHRTKRRGVVCQGLTTPDGIERQSVTIVWPFMVAALFILTLPPSVAPGIRCLLIRPIGA